MKKVLFLCVGNSCRSQIAEGFARYYGNDILEAHSAGTMPAPAVSKTAGDEGKRDRYLTAKTRTAGSFHTKGS